MSSEVGNGRHHVSINWQDDHNHDGGGGGGCGGGDDYDDGDKNNTLTSESDAFLTNGRDDNEEEELTERNVGGEIFCKNHLNEATKVRENTTSNAVIEPVRDFDSLFSQTDEDGKGEGKGEGESECEDEGKGECLIEIFNRVQTESSTPLASNAIDNSHDVTATARHADANSLTVVVEEVERDNLFTNGCSFVEISLPPHHSSNVSSVESANVCTNNPNISTASSTECNVCTPIPASTATSTSASTSTPDHPTTVITSSATAMLPAPAGAVVGKPTKNVVHQTGVENIVDYDAYEILPAPRDTILTCQRANNDDACQWLADKIHANTSIINFDTTIGKTKKLSVNSYTIAIRTYPTDAPVPVPVCQKVASGYYEYKRISDNTNLIEDCSYNIPNNFIKDVVSESTVAEKKTIKKKKSAGEESITTTRTKKTKKSKKCEEKENISVTNSLNQNGIRDLNFHQIIDDGDELSNVCVRELRSGFGKFDQLTKKTLMHVRSSDPSKVQQQFNQNESVADSASASLCKACSKNVFAMESIKAERHVWHRNCFRCKTCNKQLTVDIYSSHEGELYCKPHFRDLFKPKVVIEDDKPVKLRKPELIIRENEPVDLPPDVVRASDKPDLGLEELGNLDVKSRFQVFEKQTIEENVDKSPVCVKRSPSILSKLARFQAKGMDVGVPSDIFAGIDYEESTSSSDEDEPKSNENVTKSALSREKPVPFNKMNDVKQNWENGHAARKEERREERREELQRIRSRLFMGKQNKMKEAYENAVAESERCNVKKEIDVKADKARLIREKFEKGEIAPCDGSDEGEVVENRSKTKDEDIMDVFEAGISKKSRSLFQQMDAAIKNQSNVNLNTSSPTLQNGENKHHKKVISRQISDENVIRASDPIEEVTVKTADVCSKFKFFETYKAPEIKRKTFRITPPREGQLLQSHSPEKEVASEATKNSEDVEDENQVLKKSNTTAKMLSLFRQLEEANEVVPDGPKPMKKFTPPPASSESSSEAESEEESEDLSEASHIDDNLVRASTKTEDEYLKAAQKAAKAKYLREKFEKWEPEKQSSNNAINLLDSEQASLDTTKSLRARFESYKPERTVDRPRPKVNRFVNSKSTSGCCDTCFKKVYPLEKVEAGDKIFHRSCFRCAHCNNVLRMETFTMNNGQLYCVPHFKQLFIKKGNYDEGFGNDQHKRKWHNISTETLTTSATPDGHSYIN